MKQKQNKSKTNLFHFCFRRAITFQRVGQLFPVVLYILSFSLSKIRDLSCQNMITIVVFSQSILYGKLYEYLRCNVRDMFTSHLAANLLLY